MAHYALDSVVILPEGVPEVSATIVVYSWRSGTCMATAIAGLFAVLKEACMGSRRAIRWQVQVKRSHVLEDRVAGSVAHRGLEQGQIDVVDTLPCGTVQRALHFADGPRPDDVPTRTQVAEVAHCPIGPFVG